MIHLFIFQVTNSVDLHVANRSRLGYFFATIYFPLCTRSYFRLSLQHPATSYFVNVYLCKYSCKINCGMCNKNLKELHFKHFIFLSPVRKQLFHKNLSPPSFLILKLRLFIPIYFQCDGHCSNL